MESERGEADCGGPSETPGNATDQREQAMTPQRAPDQAPTEGAREPNTQKRTKRGRPPKNRASRRMHGRIQTSKFEVFLRRRYYSLGDRFANGRSNQDTKENWAMLAAAVGRQICADIDVGQCRNKLKHLGRLWHAYNNDRRATGNGPSPVESPCFTLMQDIWGEKDCMRFSPFISSTIRPVSQVTSCSPITLNDTMDAAPLAQDDGPVDPSTANSETTAKRKTKTQGERVAEGMHQLSESIAKVASAIALGKPSDSKVQHPILLQQLMEQQQEQSEITTQLLQQQQLQADTLQRVLAQLESIGNKLASNE